MSTVNSPRSARPRRDPRRPPTTPARAVAGSEDSGDERRLERQIPGVLLPPGLNRLRYLYRPSCVPAFTITLPPDPPMQALHRKRLGGPTRKSFEEKRAGDPKACSIARGQLNGSVYHLYARGGCSLVNYAKEIAFSPLFPLFPTLRPGRGDHPRARDGARTAITLSGTNA